MSLSPNPNLEQLKKQAKDLLRAHKAAEPSAAIRFRQSDPERSSLSDEAVFQAKFALKDAQRVIAREYGFDKWSDLKRHVESVQAEGEGFLFAEGALPPTVETLLRAVENGDVEKVAAMLQQNPGMVHARISGEMREGDTLLHRADTLQANDGSDRDDPHLTTAQLLIDQGADINAIGGRGNAVNATPLDGAVWAGNLGMVKLLLANGADPEKAADGMPTPVETAASHDRTDIFLLLIDAGACYSIEQTIQLGLLEQTRRLLDADPALLDRTPQGNVPLVVAAGKQDVFSILLERGADVSSSDANGYTPLLAARAAGNDSAIRALRDRGVAGDIFGAIAERDATKVETLLIEDPSAAHPTGDGPVPLQWATWYGDHRIVECLLKRGAEPNVWSRHSPRNRRTPLSTAIGRHFNDIVQLLLDHGADPSFSNSAGLRGIWHPLPLDNAFRWGSLSAMQMILDAGADPNECESWGGLDKMKLLLDRGRMVGGDQPEGAYGREDLCRAAASGRVTVIELLVCHGADFESVGGNGLTAIQEAKKNRHPAAVKLLTEHEAIRRLPSDEAEGILSRRRTLIDTLIDGTAHEMARLLDEHPALIETHLARITLLQEAAMAGRGAIVDAVVDGGTPMTIHALTALGRTALVASMLDDDLSLVEAVHEDLGMTPLGVASNRDQVEVAELLLDRGADVNFHAPNLPMATALHEAVNRGSLETLALLLARGADVHLKNEFGHTPAYSFYSFSDYGGNRQRMVDLLVAHGSDPEEDGLGRP